MNRVFVCLNKLNTGHKKIENKNSSLNTYTCMCVRAQRTHKQDLRSTRQPRHRHTRGPLRKARQPGRGRGRAERPHAHRPSSQHCRLPPREAMRASHLSLPIRESGLRGGAAGPFPRGILPRRHKMPHVRRYCLSLSPNPQQTSQDRGQHTCSIKGQ